MDMHRPESIIEANGGIILKSGISVGAAQCSSLVYHREYDLFSSIVRLGLPPEESTRYEGQTLFMSLNHGESRFLMSVSVSRGQVSVSHYYERSCEQQELYRRLLSKLPEESRVTHIALDCTDRVSLSPVAPLHRVTFQMLIRQEARYFPWLRERFHALGQVFCSLLESSEATDAQFAHFFEQATRFMIAFLV